MSCDIGYVEHVWNCALRGSDIRDISIQPVAYVEGVRGCKLHEPEKIVVEKLRYFRKLYF